MPNYAILNVRSISNFTITQRFNYILSCFDTSFNVPNAVYFIIFDGFVKIGRTFDLKQRYSPGELKDNVKRMVFVTDVIRTEKELKDEFSKKYKYYSEKSKERFIIKDIQRALELFDNIVKKHKTKEIKNNHVRYINSDE